MRIVFLIDKLPPNNFAAGGLQNYTLRIASAISTLNTSVCLVTKNKNPIENEHTQRKFVALSYKKKKVKVLLQALSFHKLENCINLIFDAWEIRRECLKINDVDIVQSPNYGIMGLLIKNAKTRLVVRASSYRSLWSKAKGSEENLDSRLLYYFEKKLFYRAKAVYAPSKYLANILEKELGINVDVLPTPLPDLNVEENFSWYKQNLAGLKFILYFGDIIARKGIFYLAEAMKLVWEIDPEVLLVMAGPDKVVRGRSVIDNFFQAIHPFSGNVRYASELSHSMLFPVIKAAHFVVLPSIEDNCPNTMLEAMALGKSVLGTYGSSMDEFYPASCNHLLVPKENAPALAEKILLLWNTSNNEIDQYGELLRDHIEKDHAPDKAAAALKEYFVKIKSVG